MRVTANRLLLSGIASVALALAIAGCSHTVVVGADRSLQVGLTEYRIVPQRVRVRTGALTLVVENDGRLTHNLAILSNGAIVQETPPIPPGASAELAVALAPGSYLLSSTLFADRALGEYGTLTVTS
jgi:hypothetical protein